MQYPWAVPNAKVVCIAETWDDPLNDPPPVIPKFMQTYTIFETALRHCGGLGCPGHIMLELTESRGWFYSVEAFEPVQEIKDEDKQTTSIPRSTKLEVLAELINR